MHVVNQAAARLHQGPDQPIQQNGDGHGGPFLRCLRIVVGQEVSKNQRGPSVLIHARVLPVVPKYASAPL